MRTILLKLSLMWVIAALLLSACGGNNAEPQTEDQTANEPAAEETRAAPESGNSEGSTTATEVVEVEPTEAGTEALPVISTGEGAEWTVLMYMDADDDVLEEDIFIDLNEIELVGSTEAVQVVAQLDRFKGAFDGDGDWTGAKRFFVTQDDDLSAIGSQELEDLGEADMGDPQTLVDFVAWGVQNYPAQKYALILSDHGSGWPGGWSDPDPNEGSELYTVEIVEAFQALQGAGLEKFELLGFDACLMSQLEVYATVQPFANYAVASEETEPSVGWAYAAWLGQLNENPGMEGGDLAKIIVDTYISEDQRILDKQARRDAFGNVSAEQVARDLGKSITLSAVDLDAVPGVTAALDQLAAVMTTLDQGQVAQARAYAQSFESVFGQETPSPYIDLGHFSRVLAQVTGSAEAASASDALMEAIQKAVLAEKHGEDRPGATGIAFYFPVSKLYADENAGAPLYALIAQHFLQGSSWDEFLNSYYTGATFEPVEGQSVEPASNAQVVSPGASPIEIQPIEISADTIAPDGSVSLSSEVVGENIAYVYTFAGYVDDVSGAVLVADMDFVFTDDTVEVDGVYYPSFPDNQPMSLTWEWTPTIFNLNDGQLSSFALFEPDDYGAPDEASVYSVYGIYAPADGSDPSYAQLYFADGELLQVFAFTGEDGSGAPWEIIPSQGDQFKVLYTIYTEDENGEVMTSYQEGDTFTYGEQGFKWEESPAPEGYYVVGFIAVDFDGNAYSQFAPVTVQQSK